MKFINYVRKKIINKYSMYDVDKQVNKEETRINLQLIRASEHLSCHPP
jgi:hypothetical protein